MSATLFHLEVRPRIPAPLARLEELADDLLYSWDRRVRGLFYRLDRELWHECTHNPKVFLRRVAQDALEEALLDRAYMEEYRRVVANYDAYHQASTHAELGELLDPRRDLVAYFCAEFGLHESVPIYSGGLGILAGDHCKAASDLGIPFVGVGLLYQKGYFTQTIDGQGNQVVQYTHCGCEDLPVSLVRDEQGAPLLIALDFPGRQVFVRVWLAKAGHIELILLDTHVPENSEQDRSITHQLYGGGSETRIQQEIVLGIGGTRALRLLGREPSAWHINEGHSAFQILERCRFFVQQGMDFASALERVAASTVFTTHTPVPAGHDIFSEELIANYFAHYTGELGIDFNALYRLGQTATATGGFNMTTLALKGSRFHNGVSRIHGGVASCMEWDNWPQVPAGENPIDYVTNGVHVPTFLAREWVSLFDLRFDEWQSELLNPAYWQRIEEIPDYHYWSVHKAVKQGMLADVVRRLTVQEERNGSSHAHTARMLSAIGSPDCDLLVMGFARRFATYKRAALLFADPERLAAILNHPERPGVIIFAGKAHPNDKPGQQLIRTIHEFSVRPEFLGKIILIEGYDLTLARQLVAGVDVWLNTPEYPLEASGTSGQKAGTNGGANVSVLDGWWGEGYNRENGWGITPRGTHLSSDFRYREEAQDLLDILEHEVMPTYYDRDGRGYSARWVKISKAAMQSVIPRFNSQRMVRDYVTRFYAPAQQQGRKLGADDGALSRELASWKQRVRARWPGVSLSLQQAPASHIHHDEPLPIRVLAKLNELRPEDVVVESTVGRSSSGGQVDPCQTVALQPVYSDGDTTEFALDLHPLLPGLQQLQLRMYPYHTSLSHRLEMGCMVWL